VSVPPPSLPRLSRPPSLEEALALPCTWRAAVETRFIDAMGHMNSAWYAYLFDQATWGFFGAAGVDEGYCQRAHSGMFAVEQHLRYLGELREGDAFEIHTGILELRERSVLLAHAMTDPLRARVAAVSELVGLHIDLGTRRASPFPPAIAAVLARVPVIALPPAGG
jgi:acyl-CoA thioester hydrolase